MENNKGETVCRWVPVSKWPAKLIGERIGKTNYKRHIQVTVLKNGHADWRNRQYEDEKLEYILLEELPAQAQYTSDSPDAEGYPQPYKLGDWDASTEDIPKMYDKLAALADMAAIEFGNNIGKEELDHCDMTNAFEKGQSWMYRKLIAKLTAKEQECEDYRKLLSILFERYSDYYPLAIEKEIYRTLQKYPSQPTK